MWRLLICYIFVVHSITKFTILYIRTNKIFFHWMIHLNNIDFYCNLILHTYCLKHDIFIILFLSRGILRANNLYCYADHNNWYSYIEYLITKDFEKNLEYIGFCGLYPPIRTKLKYVSLHQLHKITYIKLHLVFVSVKRKHSI